jgi:hypothetical protein
MNDFTHRPISGQVLWRTVIASLGFLSLLIPGCGAAPKQAMIIGIVSLDGKPANGGFVSFTLPDGLPHTVEIQPDGTYRVESVPPGEAVVTVSSPAVNDQARQMHIKLPKDQPTPPPAGPQFPEKYADMATTDLRFTVQAGENRFNVEMKR